MALVIHPQTQRMLDVALKGDAHALIVTGEVGVGLASVAHQVFTSSGQNIHTVLPEKDEKVDIEKGTITVQSIRRLYDLTRTVDPKGRTVIIDYAERMGVPAQNAFLKLLEEPGPGTRFVLLTHRSALLLPTILSRAQTITVKPISREQSEKVLDTLGVQDAIKRTQLLFIASGRPAEITRLVQDEAYFGRRVQQVKDAREYITSSPYARLVLANKYKNDRQGALTLIEDAVKMLQKTLADEGVSSTITIIQRLEVLHKRITEQGNVRLQLNAGLGL